MARTDPQVNIRLPQALLKSLRAAAERNNVSLTAEITARLQATTDEPLDQTHKMLTNEGLRLGGELDYRRFERKNYSADMSEEDLARLDRHIKQLSGGLTFVSHCVGLFHEAFPESEDGTRTLNREVLEQIYDGTDYEEGD